MTPQEHQLIDDLFNRIAQLEANPRDPEAVALITRGLSRAPNALYSLTQTVLVQEEALKQADAYIRELQAAQQAPQPQSGGSFLDPMRNTMTPSAQGRGSVPNVPPQGQPQGGPGWAGAPPPYPPGGDQGGYGAPPPMPPSGGPGYGAPPMPPSGGPGFGGAPRPPQGGGGGFLGTAAAALAGSVGGSLLANGLRSLMGGSSASASTHSADSSSRPWGGGDKSSGSQAAAMNTSNDDDDDGGDYDDGGDDGDYDDDGGYDDGGGDDGDYA